MPLQKKVAVTKNDLRFFSLTLEELLHVKTQSNTAGKGIFFSREHLQSKNEIRIALFINLNNVVAYENISAADFAVKIVNENGGINGKKLVLVIANDEGSDSKAIELAQMLIEDYSPRVFIGPTSSSKAKAVYTVSQPNNIPMVTNVASAVELAQLPGNGLFFRITGTNYQLVEFIADKIQQQGRHSVSVIYSDLLYSEELKKLFQQYWANLGNKINGELSLSHLVDYSTYDLEFEIKKLKNIQSDAQLWLLTHEQAEMFVRQMSQYWFDNQHTAFPTVFMGDSIKPELFLQHIPANQYLIYSSFQSACDVQLPGTIERIKKRLNQEHIQVDSLYIYDAIILAAGALTKVEKSDSTFKKAMHETSDNPELKMLCGSVKFDDRGNNLKAKFEFN